MKELQELVRICQNDLLSAGIISGCVKKWSINNRAKSRWGLCRALPEGGYEIEISALLLSDYVPDQAVKDTIVHELLHTVPNCRSHTGKWRQLATIMENTHPQYRIKRTASYAEKGIAPEVKNVQYPYLLCCQACGKIVGRQRKSKSVLNPHKFRCSCGGRIIRIK